MTLHLQLKEKIEAHFAGELGEEGVVVKQDALLVFLANGVVAELRYFDPGEYSLQWLWGDAEFRIDTAPVHRGLDTFPNHFHGTDGLAVADFVTVHGDEPWMNVRRFLDAVIENPMLDADAMAERCR